MSAAGTWAPRRRAACPRALTRVRRAARAAATAPASARRGRCGSSRGHAGHRVARVVVAGRVLADLVVGRVRMRGEELLVDVGDPRAAELQAVVGGRGGLDPRPTVPVPPAGSRRRRRAARPPCPAEVRAAARRPVGGDRPGGDAQRRRGRAGGDGGDRLAAGDQGREPGAARLGHLVDARGAGRGALSRGGDARRRRAACARAR